MSQDVVIQLEMRINDEMWDLVNALFSGIFRVDPNFLFDFQMLNNIYEYEITKNIKFEPSRIAP